jgi:archaellum component FlaG (FlaF/FlaG flagellin family)
MHLWQDAEGIYLEKGEIRNKTMSILVVGESKTVYVMTCEVVNKTTHDLLPGEVLDEYLEPEEVATYHINFTSNGKI